MNSFFTALQQYLVGRWLIGGIFVKMDGVWYSCTVSHIQNDGTRILRRDDEGGGSFHESFNGIQSLQEYS